MRHSAALIFICFVLALASVAPSHAQSARFCTAKGYLAYDAQKEMVPGSSGHAVRVVRFGSNDGIRLAGDIPLPPMFTVYHLVCNDDRVLVTGFEKVVTQCTIEVTESSVGLLSVTEDSGKRWSDAAKEGPAPVDLGIFGREAPLRLESSDPAHEYQLLRNVFFKQTKLGQEVHTKSELIQLDLKGTVLKRFVLYDWRKLESGD
jgi:hypothetical protein